MATAITVAELKKKVAERDKVCVVDVRRKADYEKSPEMIAGATWKDPDKVEDWCSQLPADEDVVVYCVKGGLVSQSVADALEKSSPGVRFLEGGLLQYTS